MHYQGNDADSTADTASVTQPRRECTTIVISFSIPYDACAGRSCHAAASVAYLRGSSYAAARHCALIKCRANIKGDAAEKGPKHTNKKI